MKNVRKITTIVFFFLVLGMFFQAFLFSANTASGLTQQKKIQNLQTFTRLFGYVKYFYPGKEAAENNWFDFALYGAQRVENAATPQELKKILQELFLPIAPALIIYDSKQKQRFSKATITPPQTAGMVTTSWQHYGDGMDTSDKQSIYCSIRLNTYTKLANTMTAFTSLTNFLNAASLQGKEFKMSAAVKVKKGRAQLWTRVDRANNKMGFFDNMDNRPIFTSDWKTYDISGTIDADATQIYFGCILIGEGEVLVDDFVFCIRDKGTQQWQAITITNPDFETDSPNQAPAKWLGGAEGYTMTVTTESASQGKQSAKLQSTIYLQGRALFPSRLSIGEHIDKEIGSGLSCLMPLALYVKDSQTFPVPDTKRFKALTTAINNISTHYQSADNLYVRLASLITTWNIFQHFFPYFDIVKTDWPAELPKALKAAYQDKTPQDFLKTLKRLTAVLKDGHVNVHLKDDLSHAFFPSLGWDWAEGQLVITHILEKRNTGLQKGDVVLEIDGVTTTTAVEREKQYISAASKGWLYHRLKFILMSGAKDSQMTLKIKRNNQVLTVSIPRQLDINQYFQSEPKRTPSGKLREGIYYLDLNVLSMPEITALMPQLTAAKGIICDLRGYPNSNHELICHLLKENDTANDWMWVPLVSYPDYQKVEYRKSGWRLPQAEPHINAPVYFLIDGRAISYAESYMGFIERYHLATIIGQPTAGTNGNVHFFSLPSGYQITWTGMRVVKENGSPHHGVGIIPHIFVERTIKGIKEGRDEFLEKALEQIK